MVTCLIVRASNRSSRSPSPSTVLARAPSGLTAHTFHHSLCSDAWQTDGRAILAFLSDPLISNTGFPTMEMPVLHRSTDEAIHWVASRQDEEEPSAGAAEAKNPMGSARPPNAARYQPDDLHGGYPQASIEYGQPGIRPGHSFPHGRTRGENDQPCSYPNRQEAPRSDRTVGLVGAESNGTRGAAHDESPRKGGHHRTSRKNNHRKERPRKSETDPAAR